MYLQRESLWDRSTAWDITPAWVYPVVPGFPITYEALLSAPQNDGVKIDILGACTSLFFPFTFHITDAEFIPCGNFIII